jgi:hypothetical protein
MKKWFFAFILGLSLSVGALPDASAQCPMCRIAAESNMKNGGTEGKGLNAGILFMLAMPYLIVGGIGYVWYRNRNKKEDVIA